MRHHGKAKSGAIALALALALAGGEAAAIDPSWSGSWYNPPESGSGFNLEIFARDRAILYWYTYDDAGEPVWLYSEGIIEGEAIDFVVYYADGMRFSDLDTADKNNRVWGSLRMQFESCDTATITYSSTLSGLPHSPVGTRTLPVERLVNLHGLPCRNGPEGYWAGTQVDPTLPGDGLSDLAGVIDGDGRLFFWSEASGEVLRGNWSLDDGRYRFDYQICRDDGSSPCVPATARVAAWARMDFLRGNGRPETGEDRPFALAYRSHYDREVSLDMLVGEYTLTGAMGSPVVLTLDAEGNFSGLDLDGCLYEWSMSQPNPAFNRFDFGGTIRGCVEVNLEGVAVVSDSAEGLGDRAVIEIIARANEGGTRMLLQRE